MAKLSLRAIEGDTLTEFVEVLRDRAPNLLSNMQGQVSLVRASKSSVPGASGGNTYVGIEIDLPDLPDETLEQLGDIFNLVAELVALHTNHAPEAKIIFDDGDDRVIHVIRRSKG